MFSKKQSDGEKDYRKMLQDAGEGNITPGEMP